MLTRVYNDVAEKLDAQSVARVMFQCNALTPKELQSIQSKHNEPVCAAEQLLNIVMNQSGNVYGCFLSALKDNHNDVFYQIVSRSYKGTYDACKRMLSENKLWYWCSDSSPLLFDIQIS